MAEGSGGFLIIFPLSSSLPILSIIPPFLPCCLPKQQRGSKSAAVPILPALQHLQGSAGCWAGSSTMQRFLRIHWVMGMEIRQWPQLPTDKENTLLHRLWHFKHFSWFSSAHARYPPLLLAQLLVVSLSLISALIDKCQLPHMPRSWQHSLPGSLLLHKVNQNSGYSCQEPGSHVIP